MAALNEHWKAVDERSARVRSSSRPAPKNSGHVSVDADNNPLHCRCPAEYGGPHATAGECAKDFLVFNHYGSIYAEACAGCDMLARIDLIKKWNIRSGD